MSTIKISTGVVNRGLNIADGRNHFWQWDTGCKLVLTGLTTVDELHYFKEGMKEPIPLKVYERGNQKLCDVPDELLQTGGDFTVYAYIIETDGCRTEFVKIFTVKERAKPTEYIYTETEKYTVAEAIADALEEAKESGYFNGTVTAEITDNVLCVFSSTITAEIKDNVLYVD